MPQPIMSLNLFFLKISFSKPHSYYQPLFGQQPIHAQSKLGNLGLAKKLAKLTEENTGLGLNNLFEN